MNDDRHGVTANRWLKSETGNWTQKQDLTTNGVDMVQVAN